MDSTLPRGPRTALPQAPDCPQTHGVWRCPPSSPQPWATAAGAQRSGEGVIAGRQAAADTPGLLAGGAQGADSPEVLNPPCSPPGPAGQEERPPKAEPPSSPGPATGDTRKGRMGRKKTREDPEATPLPSHASRSSRSTELSSLCCTAGSH